MRNSLNLLAAAALVAALGACNRGRTADEEQRALNEAAAMNDENNSIFDTSPDDMALNAEEAPAEENAPAAANAIANSGAAAGNRQ